MLKSLGKKLPRGCKNTLAKGLIIGKLSYLIGIWGGQQVTTLEKHSVYSIAQQDG